MTVEIEPTVTINQDSIDNISRIDSIVNLNLTELGFVDLRDVDSSIRIDLRYASSNNFMKMILYDSLRTVFLRTDVAERLSRCQGLLDSLKPGHFLLVYDGVRPLEVQKQMWEALDSIPSSERGKFVSNPIFGSVHNFGAAVDLTICDGNGKVLDMGAGYDDFREIAFPSLESKHLKTGELSREQYENRKLLRKVMRSQRFFNIPSEWWHFNAYSRVYCDSLFEPLQYESGN
jgi:D-alanyl-D-alanine dipeptidase